MSAFSLKVLACIAMIFDHTGEALFPGQEWMRYVGRLAFPIYAFLLTEGFIHTRDVKKYFGRLLVIALLSEVPYDLLGHDTFLYMKSQNAIFTLLTGLFMLIIMKRSDSVIEKAYLLAAAMLIAETFHFNYRYPGILMIFAFYYFRDFPYISGINVLADNVRLFTAKMQSAAGFALIPIYMYNGKKGPPFKYFFYAFYPLHLLVIYYLKKKAF